MEICDQCKSIMEIIEWFNELQKESLMEAGELYCPCCGNEEIYYKD